MTTFWFASIGELDKSIQFEARDFTDAQAQALRWLYSLGGRAFRKEINDWNEVEAEPERRILQVVFTLPEATLRRWPLSLFKQWAVKRRAVLHETTLSLTAIHDEMTENEVAEFCRPLFASM